MKENHWRSIVKGISWRIVGTIDTMCLSFLFTGQVEKAFKIGGIEVFTKIFLFYLHERVWMSLPFGKREILKNGILVREDRHYRSIIKGVSWRMIGSLDTFWIAAVINHDAVNPLQTAFYISATEVVTKVALFWLHERAWLRIKWGVKHMATVVA